MKLAIASDLHLEFGDISLHNDECADVLILAGDIVPARYISDFMKFFDEVTERFPAVIYVPGNHEFYGHDFRKVIPHMKSQLTYKNLYLLDNSMVSMGCKSFVGGTMWTNLNNRDPLTMYHMKTMMSDFRVIANFSPAQSVIEFEKSFAYISKVGAKIVITHHAPCGQSVAEKYKEDTMMNGGFYTELSDYIYHSNIDLWIHGHMHNESDYVIGDTRIICNPRGYKGIEFVDSWKLKYVEI